MISQGRKEASQLLIGTEHWIAKDVRASQVGRRAAYDLKLSHLLEDLDSDPGMTA